MKPLELALKYMDIVFLRGDFDQLKGIVVDDLRFEGPFYNFDRAEDYINSMKLDPPKDFGYEIIKSYADNSSACLIYKFSKPGISTMMTQTFDIEDDKIKSICLIFDTSAFNIEP